MGIVYAGVDAAGQRSAVKLIHQTHASDREFRDRFRREVAMLRLVRGTCCVRILDADAEAEQPWLATEYIAGRTLDDHVARHGPLTGDDLFGLAAGLAEAVVAVHAAQVVHRDLKASNVMLSPQGPRLVDFGIARSLDGTSLTATGLVVGSPAWVSPEEYAGGPTGSAADVYGWALVVVYAATGRQPYGMARPEVLALRVMNEPVDTSMVPAALRPVIDAALAKAPGARPAMDEVLAAVAGAWRERHGEAGIVTWDPAADVTTRLNRVWSYQGQDMAQWPSQPPAPPRRSKFRRFSPVVATVAALGCTAGVLLNLPSDATAGPARPSATPTAPGVSAPASPSATPAAPRTAAELAAALDLALSVMPAAEFSFDGGFTQSAAGAKASGRLVSGDVPDYDDFEMTVDAEEEDPARYVITGGELYLDRPGAPAMDMSDKRPEDATWYALMVAGMAGPYTVQQVVHNSENFHQAGRTYIGNLPATKTNGPLRSLLASWLGTDVSGATSSSYLSYRLTIDERNRPTKFSLTWKVPLDGGGTYASEFTTSYRGWAEDGEISKPS